MTTSPVSRSRPTTERRSRAHLQRIRESIYGVLEEEHPMTVRQVFYQLVSRGVIAKSEAEYKNTVVRLLSQMRLRDELPFAWIADNTRWMRKPRTFDSADECLRITAEAYRRCLWSNQGKYVEIWLEKDALAGVLYQVTSEWDVPLMVTRGYPSLSFLKEAADTILHRDVPAHLYYFGDYDPSGVNIPQITERRIREFAPDADITFHRVAVTREQITAWNLPTRPTKKTDSRAKMFVGDSVEVDAIPVGRLRDLARRCIEGQIDPAALAQTRRIEALERATLRELAV